MIFFATILVPLAWKGRILGRVSGATLIVGYLVFTAWLGLRVIG